MAIVYEEFKALKMPDAEQVITDREVMHYALSVGMGEDPMDKKELAYVFEKGLKTIPTIATAIAWEDSWIFATGLNPNMVVHGEQWLTMHRPFPTDAHVFATNRIVDIFDKGADKGAVVLMEREMTDKKSGEKIATLLMTIMARGDGGFGGPKGSGPAPHPTPDTAPEKTFDYQTSLRQALYYRLNGDRNPLHADPDFAAAGGFERPILHGLCSYGIACRAVLATYCGYDHTKLTGFDVRFSAPVIPGETLRTEMWRDGDEVAFRMRAVERDVVVLKNGKASIGGF
jgi:acyl dehydratase